MRNRGGNDDSDDTPAARMAAEESPAPEKHGPIQRWSTEAVPEDKRLDYYEHALCEAIVPLALENADSSGFRADVSFAQLDAIGVCKVTASPHGTFRGPKEFARTRDDQFNIMMSLNCPWTVELRGPLRLLPGDILVHDSRYPLRLDIRENSIGINLAVSEGWLRQWVPTPGTLVGRRIAGQSAWGSALSSFLAEISPELVVTSPLPLSILADQVGSLLALAASDLRVTSLSTSTPVQRSIRERILDCVNQRCTEPLLTAMHVASSVNISVRTLHRTLAASDETFGGKLIDARAKVAERMLASPLFNRVTTAEIGRRSGFLSPSHFTRVMRMRTGKTPMQLRRIADQ